MSQKAQSSPFFIGPLEDFKVQDDVADNECQDSALLEVKGQLECCLAESKLKDKQITELEQECHTLEVCIQDLKSKLEERNSQEHIPSERLFQTSLETKHLTMDCRNLKVEVVSSSINTTALLKDNLIGSTLNSFAATCVMSYKTNALYN